MAKKGQDPEHIYMERTMPASVPTVPVRPETYSIEVPVAHMATAQGPQGDIGVITAKLDQSVVLLVSRKNSGAEYPSLVMANIDRKGDVARGIAELLLLCQKDKGQGDVLCTLIVSSPGDPLFYPVVQEAEKAGIHLKVIEARTPEIAVTLDTHEMVDPRALWGNGCYTPRTPLRDLFIKWQASNRMLWENDGREVPACPVQNAFHLEQGVPKGFIPRTGKIVEGNIFALNPT